MLISNLDVDECEIQALVDEYEVLADLVPEPEGHLFDPDRLKVA